MLADMQVVKSLEPNEEERLWLRFNADCPKLSTARVHGSFDSRHYKVARFTPTYSDYSDRKGNIGPNHDISRRYFSARRAARASIRASNSGDSPETPRNCRILMIIAFSALATCSDIFLDDTEASARS